MYALNEEESTDMMFIVEQTMNSRKSIEKGSFLAGYNNSFIGNNTDQSLRNSGIEQGTGNNFNLRELYDKIDSL